MKELTFPGTSRPMLLPKSFDVDGSEQDWLGIYAEAKAWEQEQRWELETGGAVKVTMGDIAEIQANLRTDLLLLGMHSDLERGLLRAAPSKNPLENAARMFFLRLLRAKRLVETCCKDDQLPETMRAFLDFIDSALALIPCIEHRQDLQNRHQRRKRGRIGRQIRAEKCGAEAIKKKALSQYAKIHAVRPKDSVRQISKKIALTLFDEARKAGVLSSMDRAPQTIAGWIKQDQSKR